MTTTNIKGTFGIEESDQYPPAPNDDLICSKLSQNVRDQGAIRIQHGRKPKTKLHEILQHQRFRSYLCKLL